MGAITWEELSSHKSLDDLWIAINGRAYDVTEWSKQHPGGALVLLHFGGKDATEPFTACHPPNVRVRLPALCRGVLESSSRGTFKEQAVYAKLEEAVSEAGLLEPKIQPYFMTAALLVLLSSFAIITALQGQPGFAALAIALFWQQLAFIGHDLGHSAVTQNRRMDGLLGLLVNAGVGIGMSWWKSTHNVHHVVVNAADSDPDIQGDVIVQFMPLIAVSDHFFEDTWSKYHQDNLAFNSLAKTLISWQHFTFLPLLMIAKFGLYLQTVNHLLAGKAYIHWGLEVAAQTFFFGWYGLITYWLPGPSARLAFVLLSHAAFSILHLQICLSHFACQTSKSMPGETEDWMTQQVRGTMNWSCPWWLDWFHGGLQFQIEHHLFPRMPRHNLRAAAEHVRPACKDLGIPYHSPTFLQAILETMQTLRQVATRAQAAHIQIHRPKSQNPLPQMLSRTVI